LTLLKNKITDKKLGQKLSYECMCDNVSKSTINATKRWLELNISIDVIQEMYRCGVRDMYNQINNSPPKE